MDVAPKGAESKFTGRGSINIALLTELRAGSSPTVGEGVSEPGAGRGPRAGSPRGVVDATGSYIQG